MIFSIYILVAQFVSHPCSKQAKIEFEIGMKELLYFGISDHIMCGFPLTWRGLIWWKIDSMHVKNLEVFKGKWVRKLFFCKYSDLGDCLDKYNSCKTPGKC